MALKTDIPGMVWHYPHRFCVGSEQIRQYAKAIKTTDPASLDIDAARELGHDRVVAPLTFISILAIMIQRDFFQQDLAAAVLDTVLVDPAGHGRVALRVHVDQQHSLARLRQGRGKVGGGGGLADATLLVGD